MEETSGCLFPLSFGPTAVNPLEDGSRSPRGPARSQCIGACFRGADPLLLPQGGLGAGHALAIASLPIRLDLGPYRAEALVRDDGTLRDMRVLVEEDTAGEKLPRAKPPGEESFNRGTNGYGTVQALVRREKGGLRYAPDWTVLLFTPQRLGGQLRRGGGWAATSSPSPSNGLMRRRPSADRCHDGCNGSRGAR